jgi:hypothetical protein
MKTLGYFIESMGTEPLMKSRPTSLQHSNKVMICPVGSSPVVNGTASNGVPWHKKGKNI